MSSGGRQHGRGQGSLEEYWRALLWQGTQDTLRFARAADQATNSVLLAHRCGSQRGLGAVRLRRANVRDALRGWGRGFLPIFYGIIGLSATLSPSSSTT